MLWEVGMNILAAVSDEDDEDDREEEKKEDGSCVDLHTQRRTL
jgi:hypothetical protein